MSHEDLGQVAVGVPNEEVSRVEDAFVTAVGISALEKNQMLKKINVVSYVFSNKETRLQGPT